MNKNWKIVVALLAVLVVAVGILGYWANEQHKAQTASATATVVIAEREYKKGDDDTTLTLSYQAGGKTVQGRARVDGVVMDQYPAGRQVPICYDPANTGNLRVAEGPCGG